MNGVAKTLSIVAILLTLASGTVWAAIESTAGSACRGTDGPNTMYGSASEDRIYGKGGSDRIDAVGGVDEVYGGDGHDPRLFGGNGRDLQLFSKRVNLSEKRALSIQSVQQA
jgi:Ca2+-binding RTX toxin-like protein